MHTKNIVFAILFSLMTLSLIAASSYVFMMPTINNSLGILLIIGAGIYAFVTDGHIKASSEDIYEPIEGDYPPDLEYPE